MRNALPLVLVMAMATTLLESRGGRPEAFACAGPEQPLVRITAQQLGVAPPFYAFLVTNLSNAAITGIVLGRHDTTMPIIGVAANIPSSMEAPPGWTGQPVHVEETRYMYYLWENKDPSKRIAPQQSVAGFRLTLPLAKDPTQITLDRIPFEVALADGSCRWGVVGVDKLAR